MKIVFTERVNFTENRWVSFAESHWFFAFAIELSWSSECFTGDFRSGLKGGGRPQKRGHFVVVFLALASS